MILLGIDIGTTVLKSAVYNRRTGAPLASRSVRIPLKVETDGGREQSPTAIERALSKSLRDLEAELGKEWRKVEGVGLASQGGSTLIVRRDSGRPLTPLILWNDARAFPHFHRIARSRTAKWFRSFSFRDEPGMGLARIEWLRERSPELISRENLYVGVGEWMLHRLTGVYRQDACNALQSGCYDAKREELTGKPLKDLGLAADFFAPLRRGHESLSLSSSAAARFHLREGIPVLGPYNDHEAGYLSVSGVSKNPLACSLGTAWVGNFNLPSGVEGRSPFQFIIPSPLKGKGSLVIQPLLTGNVTWDWALGRFVSRDPRRAIELQQAIFGESILPPAGLTALPWVNRPNPWVEDAVGAGCLLGMNSSTQPADLLRAVAAGMCYEFERVFQQVKSSRTVDSIVLCGGASRGMHFQEMMAGLFDPLPVHRILDEDSMGTRGCLHAFGGKIARVEAPPVALSGRLDLHALEQGRRFYHDAFRRLYAEVPAGAAYEIRRRK